MIMNNWTILGVQSTIGLVVYTLIFFLVRATEALKATL